MIVGHRTWRLFSRCISISREAASTGLLGPGPFTGLSRTRAVSAADLTENGHTRFRSTHEGYTCSAKSSATLNGLPGANCLSAQLRICQAYVCVAAELRFPHIFVVAAFWY